MSKIINEGVCRQLVAEYFRRTQGGREPSSVVLRELMQITYAQGYQAARTVPDTHVLTDTDILREWEEAKAPMVATSDQSYKLLLLKFARRIEAASQGSVDK